MGSMAKQLTLNPQFVDWWNLLRLAMGRPGRVHVWHPADHPPVRDPTDHHQHHLVTLVLCLAGVVRMSTSQTTLDLRAGDALLIHPWLWHRHEPLRRGSLSFGQGFILGRSDYLFASPEQELIALIPAEPSRILMEAALGAADADARRAGLAKLLATVASEASVPLASPYPELIRLEIALWQSLHRTGGTDLMVRASGASRAQVFRLCREHWHAGPAAVLRRERLNMARALLAAGLPVAEVASRCGFASRQVLARNFRRAFGSPPTGSQRSRP